MLFNCPTFLILNVTTHLRQTMRKKVILADKNYSSKFHITLYKDKLINYYGISNSRFFKESNTEPKEFSLNTTFEVYKLDKFDQKEHKVKASHILRNEQLEFILGDRIRVYVNLNIFEVIRIKWIKKQYLIQTKEIKTDILKYIIGGVLGFIGAMAIQKINQYNAEPENPPRQEIKKSLDQINDQTQLARASFARDQQT